MHSTNTESIGQDIITKLQRHEQPAKLFGLIPINSRTLVLVRGYAFVGATAGAKFIFLG